MLAKSVYKVESVKAVCSADDIILMLDLGHDGLYRLTRCRLAGVDTPSTFNTESVEAANLKTFVSKALNMSKGAYIEVVSFLHNSWLVHLYTKDPETKAYVSLNQVLINNGYVFHKRGSKDV